MIDKIEEIASHIILMSARGDIAPISAKDALAISEAIAANRADPCTFPSCNCFDTNVCGNGGSGQFAHMNSSATAMSPVSRVEEE